MIGSHRYSLDIGKGTNRFRNILIIAVLLLVTVGGVVLWGVTNRSPLPGDIQKQVSFAVLLPAGDWQVPTDSYRFINDSSVLQFTANNTSLNRTLSFSQQPTPSQFDDIPQYFPALLTKLNAYDTVSTVQGPLRLTRPTELQGRTQAVLNANGTLVFASPNQALTVQQWRQLFNDMQLLK